MSKNTSFSIVDAQFPPESTWERRERLQRLALAFVASSADDNGCAPYRQVLRYLSEVGKDGDGRQRARRVLDDLHRAKSGLTLLKSPGDRQWRQVCLDLEEVATRGTSDDLLMAMKLKGVGVGGGITVADFAAEVGVTEQTVRNWMNSKNPIPMHRSSDIEQALRKWPTRIDFTAELSTTERVMVDQLFARMPAGLSRGERVDRFVAFIERFAWALMLDQWKRDGVPFEMAIAAIKRIFPVTQTFEADMSEWWGVWSRFPEPGDRRTPMDRMKPKVAGHFGSMNRKERRAASTDKVNPAAGLLERLFTDWQKGE